MDQLRHHLMASVHYTINQAHKKRDNSANMLLLRGLQFMFVQLTSIQRIQPQLLFNIVEKSSGKFAHPTTSHVWESHTCICCVVFRRKCPLKT
jgi:hypothetical protein